MTVTVYVPKDAGALSLGAGELAEAISKEAAARGLEIAGIAVGATQGYIYLRAEHPRAYRALDSEIAAAYQARYAMEFCAVESCGKCTPCRIGSTRGVEVINRILEGVESERNVRLLEDLCETMLQGSLGGLGGMTPFPCRAAPSTRSLPWRSCS